MWRRIIFLFLVLAGSVGAAEIAGRAELSHDRLTPGMRFRVAVVLDIAKPWHANANPATLPELIPTELTLSAVEGIEWGRITYPAGVKTTVAWADEPVALYEGQVVIVVEGRVGSQAVVGPRTIAGTVTYQACDDTVCLAPKKLPVSVMTVVGTEPAQEQHAELFGASAPPANQIDASIQKRGLLLTLVFIFLGGLALNLTPCVYPMIAITVSYFGGAGEKKLRHALVYALGIIVTYTALGVAAAATGKLFGALLQSPAVLVGVAVLLVILALSMFGLFEIQPPQFLMQRAAGANSKAGLVGVFFLGATLGIVAAPCLAPFVVALLAYVGTSGQWWLFIFFSAGLALPYVILGRFSGLLTRLPKSGTWMVWVKRVFGVLLVGVAVWFVWPVLGPKSKVTSPIAWQAYAPELLANPGQPVLIDFYADWCIPCHEMDKRTFTDPRVIEESKKFRMVKADLTRTGSPDVEKLTREFGIVGVPTFVFLNPAGGEVTALRQVGFVRADEFLRVMRAAQSAPATTNAVAPAAEPDALRDIPPQLMRPF